MAYHYSIKTRIPFTEAIAKVTSALQENGFGIITSIDMKNTLKQKLNREFRNYQILGACNPEFAFKAISLESHIGLMLPCNVVVQEHENGEIEVSAINPMETMDRNGPSELMIIASEVSGKLRNAVDKLHNGRSGKNEALPTDGNKPNVFTQIPG